VRVLLLAVQRPGRLPGRRGGGGGGARGGGWRPAGRRGAGARGGVLPWPGSQRSGAAAHFSPCWL